MRIQKGIDMQGGMISAQLRSSFLGKKGRKKFHIWINKSGAFAEIGFPGNLNMKSLWHPRFCSKKCGKRRKKRAGMRGNFSYQTIIHECASDTFVCKRSRCRLIPSVLIHRLRPKPLECLLSRYALSRLELLACITLNRGDLLEMCVQTKPRRINVVFGICRRKK